MRVGHLYRIVQNRHTDWQMGNIVICLKTNGSWIFTGYNVKTMRTHHYHNEHVELVCE